MTWTSRTVLRLFVVPCSLSMAATLVRAHETSASESAQGLGFGYVVTLTVVLGVLGGVVVVRRRPTIRGRRSALGLSTLLIVVGCWAAVVAARERVTLTAAVVVAGATITWSLRRRVVGDHHGCDQAALGAVVLHRFVEGTLLAALYSAAATVGLGAALAIAAHTAAETGAVAGLWSGGRGEWLIVGAVQAAFVAGALGGTFVARLLPPLASVAILALLGGTLIASGVATASSRQHGPAASSSPTR